MVLVLVSLRYDCHLLPSLPLLSSADTKLDGHFICVISDM